MAAKETIALFVHGANQSDINELDNKNKWEEAFQETEHSKKVFDLITGVENLAIQTFYDNHRSGEDYPQFSNDWKSIWYGGIWAAIANNEEDPFESVRLNKSVEDEKERFSLIQKIEQQAMQKHFDELVPFYELAVLKNDGQTLYEKICGSFLNQLMQATTDGKNYVIIAHSMGCAVSYNVLSHISNAKSNKNYCPLPGTLSEEYRETVKSFANTHSECLGLHTFGNYTGYNWSQRLNNKVLYGELKKQFVYPIAASRWCNYWTTLGGDPYILDDKLGADVVGDEKEKYEDVMVLRMPLTKISHSRRIWFGRKQFSKKLYKKLFE